MSPPLNGRRVAVYVGGSVAAFKSGDVVTGLRTRGAETRVAMTAGAERFITALTLQSLSGHSVATDLWQGGGEGHAMEHLTLSAWAEVQIVVPASANLIARLALGLADDAVTASALACTAPLVLAPAMESAMWEHPATQHNVATLRGRGATFVGPIAGRLASGKEGIGRIAGPEEIVEAVAAVLAAGSGG